MIVKVNHGVGKSSELYVMGKDDLIDLNKIYAKLIKGDKLWRLEVYSGDKKCDL